MRIYDTCCPITEQMMNQVCQPGYTLLAHSRNNEYNDTMLITLDLALRAVKQKKKNVLYISTEAPIDICFSVMHKRRLSPHHNGTGCNIVNASSVTEEPNATEQNPREDILYVYDAPGIHSQDIRETLQRIRKQNNPDMIVVDFLPMLSIDGCYASRREEIAVINAWLNCAAEKWHLPIVTACLSEMVDIIRET